MRRREFITLLGGAVSVGPLAARAPALGPESVAGPHRGGVKWCTKTESQKAFRPMNGRNYTRNRCFYCGRLLRGQNSREHVFPKWLQEKFNLWDLAAENIPADILIDLVRGGLAVARDERLEDEDGAVDVTRMWITEAGELALAASRI